MQNSKKSIIIFTDGASRGNPGSGGWAAIIVEKNENTSKNGIKSAVKNGAESIAKSAIKNISGNVKEIGGREENTTNNRMELQGVIEGLSQTALTGEGLPIFIYIDSAYVINGITKWLADWIKNNWKTSTKKEVMNQDLWQELFSLTEGKDIIWKYAKGHSGIVGNERCDEISTDFADGKLPKLYDGPLSAYSIDILNVESNEVENSKDKEERRIKKSRSKQKAYSYLSLLDGVLMKHATWEECEKRVKGKNAKFKKALSAEEEMAIIKEWGM